MKKHQDLITVLRSHRLRITPARRILLQFILDNKAHQLSLKDFHQFLERKLSGVNRSSIYRNLEMFKKLDIIQELNLPDRGKCFQYVFEGKVHHYYICKQCGKLNRGNAALFEKINRALKDVHGFSKANLSIIFYGYCAKCEKDPKRPSL